VRKPAEDIFRFALDGLGMAPEETAMIGDSLLADVRGANRLGMLSIWMPTARLRALARQELATSQAEPEDSLTNAALTAFAIKHYRTLQYVTETTDAHLQPDLVISNLSELLDTFTGVTE
jgi:FMN phosphatase YigB (HAD superfamily)